MIGDLHTDRRTIAWCATDCRQRYARCDAFHGGQHDPRVDCRTAWSGHYPGFPECRTLGWFAVLTPQGWVPAPPDAPGAVEDLDRLMRDAVWNPQTRRYDVARPEETGPATTSPHAASEE